MNITWNFSNFNVYKNYDGLQNVVYSYQYSVTVTDGQASATRNGMVRLNFDKLTQAYTPFEALTPQIVQQWTESTIDTVTLIKNLSEAVLAKGAQTERNLTAPWITPSTPPNNP